MLALLWKIFIEPTDSTAVQLFRTIIIGFISLAVDLAVLSFLTETGVWYIASAAVGFLVSLIVNWILNRTFVFTERSVPLSVEIVMYALISAVGLALTETVMYSLVEFARLPYQLAKLAAAAVVLMWTFTARKKLLYRN